MAVCACLFLTFQLLDAILGAGVTWVTLGGRARSKASLGATFPTNGTSDLRALLVEFFITFLLVFVIIATATDKRVPAALAAPSIGFALVAAVLIGGGVVAPPIPIGLSDRWSCPSSSPLFGCTSWARSPPGSSPRSSTSMSSAAPLPHQSRSIGKAKEDVSAGDRTLATGTDTAQ